MSQSELLTPLTRKRLDAVTITGGDHDGELVFHASCHPAAGLCVAYDRTTGTLTLTCSYCDRLVAAVVVQP